jgi:parallel beta-helix repeat protein
MGVSFTGSTHSLSMIKSQILSFEGKTLYVGGSGEGNYTSIREAINDANDGDTVFVYDDSSPYEEWAIKIYNSINLIGENRDTTVINDGYGIEVEADGVTISGFTITKNGLETENSRNLVVSDNHFIEGRYYGIVYDRNDNGFIISNTFKDCEKSIVIEYCNNIRISNNTMEYTIATEEIVHGEIWCVYGNNHIFTNNTFINHKKEAYRNCLNLIYVRNSIITGNEFNGYEDAIWTYAANTNIISYNSFINNDLAVTLGIVSGSNKVNNNNFINNRYDACLFPLFKDNWDGNYWDKYKGKDNDGDGIGDTPHISFGGLGFAIDHYPAMKPYNITTTQGCGIK